MYEVTIKAESVEKLWEQIRGLISSEEKTADMQQIFAEPETIPEGREQEPGISLEELRGALAELTRAGHREEARKILQSFGAAKLTELKPAQYGACYVKVQEIKEAV